MQLDSSLSSFEGPDGTLQIIKTDQSKAGKNGDRFRYLETRVHNVIFRPIRRGKNFVGLSMIEGSSERRGAWDDVRIWMEGKLCRLDEGSEMAAYAIEPRGQWIYQDRGIERGLNVATVYKVEKDSIVLTHFEGLRLDEYLIRRYLQSMGRVHVEHNLYNRTIHFERWLPKGGLRVNMSLQWGDGPKQQNFGGIFELNLLQKRVMHMEDISKLVHYNYQPNRKS